VSVEIKWFSEERRVRQQFIALFFFYVNNVAERGERDKGGEEREMKESDEEWWRVSV